MHPQMKHSAGGESHDALYVPCTIKVLPAEKRVAAAQQAVKINPRNSPPMALLGLVDDTVIPPEHLALLTAKYWGNGGVQLTVGFLDNPAADLRARIISHMNAWSSYCNVHFTESNTSPQVRINRGAGGYWSYLGTDILHIGANAPTMNLQGFTMSTPESEFHRVVRHETGHTLGFPHEHTRTEIVNRIDQTKAITYFMSTQGWSRDQVIAQVLTPLDNSALIETAQADGNSIMCYGLPASIMKDGVAVPGGIDIDPLDQQFAGAVYPLSPYTPVYAQGDPGNGIGGYDLKSAADRAFAFDYNHSGKQDHLALYRPGTGTFWIVKNTGGAFSPVYHQGDPGNGIGGYDLKDSTDRAFAFDYEHSGKLDYICLYHPGSGACFVVKNNNGTFTPVYSQGGGGSGIGGFDLRSTADRAFAFDYDHSGKLDHICIYRPGTGTIWILKNNGGNFSAVYHQGDPGNGIGGYDLRSANDQIFALDYDHSGKQDYLACYRPGTGTFWILKNNGGNFSAVYHQGDPGSGIGGYDLKNSADRAFAFDFDRSGKLDHVCLYRPGHGTIWVVKNSGGNFSPVVHIGDPGPGIGGYDLQRAADQVMAFDYSSAGRQDYLTLYRPGKGAIFILQKK